MAANTLSKKAKRHAARKQTKEETKVVQEEPAELIQEEAPNDSDDDSSSSSVYADAQADLPEAVLSDVESDQDDDNEAQATYIPKNDEAGMLRLLDRFKLKSLPWIETMEVTSSEPVEVDLTKEGQELDMAREVAFYQQALEAARIARDKFKAMNVPFSRPDDYYAEMLKSDEHMAKVRQRLLDESAKQQASEEARRQRQLKKFGKKVQVEKQIERQKQKTQMLDKIKLLKRKRKDAGENLTTDTDFDIALEDASAKKKAKTQQPGKPTKRQLKDKKYGFGGKRGKHHKSNTAESSADIGGWNKKKNSNHGANKKGRK
ncbi:eukaryotic rRNA processing protein EBP2-domain-containing protein [Gongronella butleri]|nr:eukaryotic rRNA processing protein EBP2-domain-containing protein [Gongronella butleri]